MIKKTEAIELFGSQSALARAVKTSRQAVWKWPEILSDRIACRVIVAAQRHNKAIPSSWNR